ncbi:MAG: hypothetical protein HY586_06700 [Candidatus Omnitrophica bacterium]|nr:hypothetical protein [Candidatus Omnitrophota bacterium]
MRTLSGLGILFFSIALAGCQTTGARLAPFKIQTASLGELTAKINHQSASLRTLRTKLDLRVRDNSFEGARECQGLLAYEAPAKIYFKAYRTLLPSFFTIVADSRVFHVHIPKENRVLTGNIADLGEMQNVSMGIRPDDLLRALTIQPIPSSKTHLVEMQEAPREYVLFVFRKMGDEKILERQIFVERYFLHVAREVFYNSFGVAELDIARTDYRGDKPGIPFPREIVMFRPNRGSTLFLRIHEPRINTALKEELFEFKVPQGAIVEQAGHSTC